MKLPKISVIMSVYNGERYLSDAVESILNQSFRDFEFIIIDDCSTDNSYDLLEKFANNDSRIKIIRKEKNIGVKGFIENLNIGLDKALGKYIARMDQDDISHPNRFKKQIDFLENNKDVFIVGCQLQLIDEENKETGMLIAPTADAEIKKAMPKKISLYHPVIMFRNGFNIRYRDKMLYCEDYDLYLRLMTSDFKMANIDEPLLRYRIHGESISRKNIKFIKNLFIFKMFEFYNERKETKTDTYESFNPDNFINIRDSSYHSSLADLDFAAKTAVATYNKKELNLILEKMRKQHSVMPFKYRICSRLPNPILKIYNKFS